MDSEILFSLLMCGFYAFIYLGVPILTFVLYRRLGPERYRPQNRRRRQREEQERQAQAIDPSLIQVSQPLLPDPNVLDKNDWEFTAVDLFRRGQELSAVELIQNKTGLSLDDAKIKVLKLDEAIA